jgi:methylase of polypeptide subunit release factors
VSDRGATPLHDEELSEVVSEPDIRGVRDALLAGGWEPGTVAHRMGDEVAAALERAEPAPVLEAFDSRDLCSTPFGVLTRLFGLRLPVRTDLVADALPLDAAIGLGLIETVGEYVRARLQVTPFDRSGWWVVSDWSAPVVRGPLPDSHVLGYSGASRTLATLTPRDAVAVAADIGTGSGVQALLLTDHADRVIATDVDDRALALALRTFALSDVDVELRKGSLLEPLAGERVDLLVSNPPFVIGRHGSTFRDAGFDDDGLGQQLLRDLAAHLTPTGIAVILLNWLHTADRDWRDHLRSWVGQAPLDAWFAQRQLLDPAAYASAWLSDIGLDPRAHAGDQRRWLQALQAAGAKGVGMGWAVLTTSSESAQSPTVAAEDVSTAIRVPTGDEVLDALGAVHLESLDAFALLESTPSVASGTRLFRAVALGGPTAATPPLVGIAGGWRGDVVIDDLVAFIVEQADGTTSVSDLIDAAAVEFEADPDEVLGGVLISLRGLVQTGVLRLD